jgi:hypothetical protein
MIKIIKKESDIDLELPFFAQEKYLSSKSDDYGWFCLDNFVLPFLLYKNFIFKRIVFTNEVLFKKNVSIEEEQLFLEKVVNYIKDNKICDYVYKPNPNAVFRIYPRNGDSFKWASYVMTPESNIENMITKITLSSERTKIRKAIKDGVKIELTDDYELVYNLCNETLTRQNIQLSINKKEFFNQFKLLYPNNLLMFKATYNDKVEAVTVIFKDKNNAYSKYIGRVKHPHTGIVRLLNLFAIKYLKDTFNIKNFDFIGAIPDIIKYSKECRIQKFKKEFGATLKQGYQFRVIINPFKYFFFNNLLKIKLKLKRINYIDPVERDKKLSKSNLKV